MNKTLAQIDRNEGVLWRFDTKRFTVAFWAEEEELPPEDSFEFPEDVEFAREGDPSHWFCAFVGVFEGATDEEAHCVGYDCLGGCSYNSFDEFVASHREGGEDNRNCFATKARNVVICHYFPSMVREAISQARAAYVMATQ
jgi:hypothetical protein